ncbi:MAG: NADH-quinone oxidoreductase subunit C [Candidatus Desulforudis sp.]|nr:NADH-quinone oxidoreductase subunit C [Desulforudis sp.]
MQQVPVEADRDTVVGPEELVPAVERLVAAGTRLTTMVCLDVDPEFELIYLFQQSTLELVRLRVRIGKGQAVPSISSVLLGAALIENEIKEFFGVEFTDLALDFQCRMLMAAGSPKTPLLKITAESKFGGVE